MDGDSNLTSMQFMQMVGCFRRVLKTRASERKKAQAEDEEEKKEPLTDQE